MNTQIPATPSVEELKRQIAPHMLPEGLLELKGKADPAVAKARTNLRRALFRQGGGVREATL